MAITRRARKILWARSGNKCVLCKTGLIKSKSESENSTVIGEECHIISIKAKGPRHIIIKNYDYDQEDNLILLCANCHKIVDEQTDYYTTEKVIELKINHENYIRSITENKQPKDIFPKFDGVTLLPKINSGKELYDLLANCMALEFDFEDTSDINENNFISGIAQDLNDYMDFFSFEIELGAKLRQLNPLNELIHLIKQNGFILFGYLRKEKIAIGDNRTDTWDIVTFSLLKEGNSKIIERNTKEE